MTNTVENVTRPRHLHTSVVRESAPAIAPDCARRNVCHDAGRVGPGGRPWAFKMGAPAERPTWCRQPSTLLVDGIEPFSLGGFQDEHLYLRIYNEDPGVAPQGHTWYRRCCRPSTIAGRRVARSISERRISPRIASSRASIDTFQA